MVSLPKVIGSFQDLKFRQALAELLATAPRILYTKSGIAFPGTATDYVFASKTITLDPFSKDGSGLDFYIGASLANTAPNKGLRVDVLDETGSSIISISTGFAAFGGAARDIIFAGSINRNGTRIEGHSYWIVDPGVTVRADSTSSGVYTAAKKLTFQVYGLVQAGWAANDIIVDFVKFTTFPGVSN